MLDKAEPVADHILLELGFSVRRDGLCLRGIAEVTPFMHAPGTACLRTSILAIWADMVTGLLAADTMGPRVPVTLELDVQLYRPAPSSGPVSAVGRVVKAGRSVFVAEVSFFSSSGAEFAFGAASFMLSPNSSLTLPSRTSVDLPPTSFRLPAPLAERAGLTRVMPGVASLPRSEKGLNSSGTVNGGLIALCAEEAVLSLTPGETLSSLALRYLAPVRVGPATAVAVIRDGLARVTLRDAGREDRLSVIATARTFAA
jgi:acyl-coenzyme A thioesterase PaaI-like protein